MKNDDTAAVDLAASNGLHPKELFKPRERFINRELSWLDFNERVLELAENPDLPLLERAKFLAIFASNLDEFYMVRVAGLKRQVDAGITSRSADGLTPREQLAKISEKAVPLVTRHAQLFEEVGRCPDWPRTGVPVLRWAELDGSQRAKLDAMFTESIFPVLTPLAVDPGRPFPYISNLSLNLAVTIKDRSSGQSHFARVKVPPLLPRFISTVANGPFVPLGDVIAANLDQLFPGMEVVETHTFRVTRNADLEIDDGADDLLEALEEELRKRRFSPAVRLEIERTMPEHILELLMTELEVEPSDVHSLPGPLDLTGLWGLHEIDRPDLKDEPFKSVPVPALASVEDDVEIFDVIKRDDVLVHHPYESFTTSVQRFIEQAAADPDVLAIKQTLYRTHGIPIIDALIEAAEAGKQVVVLVEIKARFDEHVNIRWVRALEQAGCHVVYGLVGLKTHCKLCLVVRREGGKLRRYVHVGTGNYNPATARIYEDLGLLTSDAKLGAEVSDLFNYLTGFSRNKRYRTMMVAPHGMRKRMIRLIEREVRHTSEESPGRIAMKLNSLVDPQVIDALYKASQQGVQVDLVIRGICSLRPGVPGLSDNIRVRSIVGRFLEHSRIFYFHKGGSDEVYIGSADMMQRNLNGRVETLVKVKAPELKKKLKGLIDLALEDNGSSWSLEVDGSWARVEPQPGADAVRVSRGVDASGLRRTMRELEVKLSVDDPFVTPPLAEAETGIAGMQELPALDLRATYYDTPDLRLARYGITLRYRSGEDKSVWTLKLPLGSHSRAGARRAQLRGRRAARAAGGPGPRHRLRPLGDARPGDPASHASPALVAARRRGIGAGRAGRRPRIGLAAQPGRRQVPRARGRGALARRPPAGGDRGNAEAGRRGADRHAQGAARAWHAGAGAARHRRRPSGSRPASPPRLPSRPRSRDRSSASSTTIPAPGSATPRRCTRCVSERAACAAT